MLAHLLKSYPDPIYRMADHWLSMGAKTFTIRLDGKTLASWSNSKLDAARIITEKILLGARIIGELQVSGLNTPTARKHLKVDADTIASLAQLYQSLTETAVELVDTRDHLLALYEMTRATRDCWELAETMRHLVAEATRMIKVESAFLVLDTDEGLARTAQTADLSFNERTLYEWAKRVKEKGSFILLDKSNELSQFDRIHSVLLTPIKIFDQPAGALGVVTKNGRDFMSPDIKLSSAIAEFTGTRLEIVVMYEENLERARYQTEMALAHDVQYQLLPKKPPVVEGLDLWASSQPASQIGGDFYDFIVQPNQPFIFGVGDVSGKGIPAALLMTVTRTVMRMAVKQTPEISPETILQQSNTALYEDLTSLSMLITAFVAQYCPLTQEFVFSNAGHSPVIYLPFGGKAHLIKANETALGIFPSTQYKKQYIKLKPGDIFFVGSDGLFRSSHNGDSFHGYEHIVNILEEQAHMPAEKIAGAILDSCNAISRSSLEEDDRTIVVIKKVCSP